MKLDLTKCKVRWDRDNYVPKKVYDFETEPLAGEPRKVAESFLKENLEVLKISAPLSDLQFEQVTESLGGKAVLFQQHFEGTPIHGAWVAIHINNAKRIFMVMNDTVPAPTLEKKLGKRKTADFLSEKEIDAIIAKKAAEYGTLATEIGKENMVYAMKGTFKPVCKAKFGTDKPAGSWILFIDRVNGHIIDERNVLHKATGKGKVFLPNPVVTLDRDDLLDLKDSDQAVLAPAYKTVQLQELDGSGFLKGAYVDITKTKNSAQSATLEFLFNRFDDHFEEVMAYYHIDSIQRYIQSLGFTGSKGALNRPIRVNTRGTFEDNSFYDPSPGRKDITFGTGGVDDAEDAEIIVHEYGHAIQDAIVPGYGQKTEGRAMGEGFGDYLAGTFYYKYKKAPRKVKLGEWDAKGYKPPQECLRKLESPKMYPADMEGEEHSDGEIWSAVLWQVRKLLGAKKSDTVIIESQFYLSQYADFKDGAEAIIMAEKNLYGGKKTKGLTRIFKNRGILA
jgi:Zn-dependent metalloprotease